MAVWLRGICHRLAELSHLSVSGRRHCEQTNKNQLHHLSRWLHAAGFGQFTTTITLSTRKQSRRRPSTTTLGTVDLKDRPTTQTSMRARRQKRNFSRRCYLAGLTSAGRRRTRYPARKTTTPYCQDNELTCLTGNSDATAGVPGFVRLVCRVRHEQPVFSGANSRPSIRGIGRERPLLFTRGDDLATTTVKRGIRQCWACGWRAP